MNRWIVFLGMLWWCSGESAGLPPKPVLDLHRAAVARKVEKTSPVAVLTLSEGELYLWDKEGRRIEAAKGERLHPGDVVYLPMNSRIHLILPRQDHLDVVGGAWFRLGRVGQEVELTLWEGRYLIRVIPGLSARRHLVRIRMEQGDLQLAAAQVGVGVQPGTNEVLVFDGRAIWNGRLLVARERLVATPTGEERRVISEPSVIGWVMAVSPLVPVLQRAIALYREGEKDRAWDILTEIQEAFPESALAAYYLGQIALERGDLTTGVQQWRLYQRLDPEGARQKQVNRYLVALLTKEIEREIKKVLAQEKQLERSVPEPNTLAVAPFILKGNGVDAVRARRIGKALAALIVADLNKIPGLKVLERARLERLLDELKLSASGLTDPRRSVEIGRLLRAERLLVGEYELKGGR